MPPDVDLGCNPADTGPGTTGWATAADICDLSPAVTYSDSVSTAGCTVRITRTWSAADACGNVSTGDQIITYTVDTIPPGIVCPGDITRYVHEPPGTWVWVEFSDPIATDGCDPSPNVSCTPSGGYFQVGTTAQASMTCTATDGCGNSATAECSFLVTVEFENSPPVAQGDSAECNGVVTIPVLANDYDPDGDSISIVSVSEPSCGTAYVSGDAIVYTTAGWRCAAPPGPGVRDSFSYTITDGYGGYDTAGVTVKITCQIYPTSISPGGE